MVYPNNSFAEEIGNRKPTGTDPFIVYLLILTSSEDSTLLFLMQIDERNFCVKSLEAENKQSSIPLVKSSGSSNHSSPMVRELRRLKITIIRKKYF